jgi:predicted GNAT superfamily acetyltransferase
VELPPNITEMRAQFPDLAMQWQLCFRQIFGEYLEKYVVTDCLKENGRTYYALVRQELIDTSE